MYYVQVDAKGENRKVLHFPAMSWVGGKNLLVAQDTLESSWLIESLAADASWYRVMFLLLIEHD